MEATETKTATGTATARENEATGQAPEKKIYAVQNEENGTLQFGNWTTPPPGAKVITTRAELFEACANYTKSDVLEAVAGLLSI